MDASISQLQENLFEMLCEIDGICKKNNIKYMLFAGSQLGAVRHHGFIPWDDDLDIIMMRPDYEKFLTVAEKELDEKYFLQKEYSEHWPIFYSKLRKNGTAYMEKYYPEDKKQHQGIFVDIFPCDNLSDSPLKAKLQFYASKIVIAKSLYKRGYLTDSKKKKIFMKLCSFLPLNPFRKFVENRKENSSQNVHSFFGASSKFSKSIYQREWMENTAEKEFVSGNFPVSAYSDELLTRLYGDYMTPPKAEEIEIKFHAMKVDLQNSYENYIDWQSQQKITIYTRSIR